MTSMPEWVTFFVNAGIPKDVASEYALSFSENRISMDLLGDLDKDYLKDMNITVTGDIILILRHAKDVIAKSKLKSFEKGATKKPMTSSLPVVEKKQNTAKTEPAKVKKVSKPQSSSNTVEDKPIEKSSNAAKESVSQRLGPPLSKQFLSNDDAEQRGGIFDRLGGSVDVQKPEIKKQSAFSRLDVSGSGRPSESAREHAGLPTGAEKHSVSGLKRKSAGTVEDDVTAVDCGKAKKKRYVLVKTLPNGKQIKTVISPNDPILSQVEVKKIKVPSKTSIPASEKSTKIESHSADRNEAKGSFIEISKSKFRSDNVSAAPVKSRMDARLSVKPREERKHSVFNRISPPSAESNHKPTRVFSSNVKDRLAIKTRDATLLERTPQRKSHSGHEEKQGSIFSRLG